MHCTYCGIARKKIGSLSEHLQRRYGAVVNVSKKLFCIFSVQYVSPLSKHYIYICSGGACATLIIWVVRESKKYLFRHCGKLLQVSSIVFHSCAVIYRSTITCRPLYIHLVDEAQNTCRPLGARSRSSGSIDTSDPRYSPLLRRFARDKSDAQELTQKTIYIAIVKRGFILWYTMQTSGFMILYIYYIIFIFSVNITIYQPTNIKRLSSTKHDALIRIRYTKHLPLVRSTICIPGRVCSGWHWHFWCVCVCISMHTRYRHRAGMEHIVSDKPIKITVVVGASIVFPNRLRCVYLYDGIIEVIYIDRIIYYICMWTRIWSHISLLHDQLTVYAGLLDR